VPVFTSAQEPLSVLPSSASAVQVGTCLAASRPARTCSASQRPTKTSASAASTEVTVRRIVDSLGATNRRVRGQPFDEAEQPAVPGQRDRVHVDSSSGCEQRVRVGSGEDGRRVAVQ